MRTLGLLKKKKIIATLLRTDGDGVDVDVGGVGGDDGDECDDDGDDWPCW